MKSQKVKKNMQKSVNAELASIKRQSPIESPNPSFKTDAGVEPQEEEIADEGAEDTDEAEDHKH